MSGGFLTLAFVGAVLVGSLGPVQAQLSPTQQAYTAGTYAGQQAAHRFLASSSPDATSQEIRSRAVAWAQRESAACQAAPTLTCDSENMGRLPAGTENDFMRGFAEGFDLGAMK
jgi:hypothetical protein